MADYSITWNYIVQRMKDKFGINIDNDEKFSMFEIQIYIDNIWDEYVDIISKKESNK